MLAPYLPGKGAAHATALPEDAESSASPLASQKPVNPRVLEGSLGCTPCQTPRQNDTHAWAKRDKEQRLFPQVHLRGGVTVVYI